MNFGALMCFLGLHAFEAHYKGVRETSRELVTLIKRTQFAYRRCLRPGCGKWIMFIRSWLELPSQMPGRWFDSPTMHVLGREAVTTPSRWKRTRKLDPTP